MSERDLSIWADGVLEDADCEADVTELWQNYRYLRARHGASCDCEWCVKARDLLMRWRQLGYGLIHWRELTEQEGSFPYDQIR